jgi:hypothetical protein
VGLPQAYEAAQFDAIADRAKFFRGFAGEVVALKKKCACHADRRKHNDSGYGYKQTALSPKRPHPSSLPLPTNGETNVEELQRPFLRSSQGSYFVTLADQAAALFIA